jgi:hypothetical protein
VETKIIETEGAGNWGKFLIGRPTWERGYPSALPDAEGALPLARWQPTTLLVLDLATGEGAFFVPGGLAEADLRKHQVWVCPMFGGFLEWLYRQDLTDLQQLPALVHLPDNEFRLAGYRRGGPLREIERLANEALNDPALSVPAHERVVQVRDLAARLHHEESRP